MASRHYRVTNDYVDRESGETIKAGSIIEIDEKRVEAFRAADVIGDEVPAPQGAAVPPYLTKEEFEALSADEQRSELSRLSIEGDDSNATKRVELYASFLEVSGNKGE